MASGNNSVVLLGVVLLFVGMCGALDSTRRSSWVVFCQPFGKDVLERSILDGVVLTKEDLRNAIGLSEIHVHGVTSLVNHVGGNVSYISPVWDRLHVELPWSTSLKTLKSGNFYRKSVSMLPKDVKESYMDVIGVMADALQVAGLSDVFSHMILHDHHGWHVREPQIDIESAHHIERHSRRLLQNQSNTTASSPNEFSFLNFDTPPSVASWKIFYDKASDAIMNIGTWYTAPLGLIQCQGKDDPYFWGASAPTCVKNMDVILEQAFSADLNALSTVRLGNLTSSVQKKTCMDVPDICEFLGGKGLNVENDTYVFGIPLHLHSDPQVLYRSSAVIAYSDYVGNVLNRTISLAANPVIYNYFNASAQTIRQLYGVDDDTLVGTKETAQLSSLAPGLSNGAVNVSQLDYYLDSTGITSYRAIEVMNFTDSQDNNNISLVCTPDSGCLEVALDVQTQMSLAPNGTTYFVPTVDYSNNATAVREAYFTFFDNLIAGNPAVDIISWSWTWDYIKYGLTVDILENNLRALVSKGITILVSSGDSGASGFPSGCRTSAQDGPMNGNIPDQAWPTVSPWVTSVGGTGLLAKQSGGGLIEEVVCSASTFGGITSGGGFSGTWFNQSTPEWQKPFVDRYLRESNQSTFSGFPTANTPGYNPGGRGYPDITAYGAHFPIINPDGDIQVVSGTSLSTPLVASLFMLANQRLLQDGYRKIGYANPMLYWMADNCPDVFTDITQGNNQNSQTPGQPCAFGFPSAKGWDPVTGLGSINLEPFVDCTKRYQEEKDGTSSSGVTVRSVVIMYTTMSFFLLL
ncbi:hypothetical protein M9434_003989 [Picochlorum sp. BPE23]|nr:hypothetical protein M9434_003989 [Picochlorum sp. BPE23]